METPSEPASPAPLSPIPGDANTSADSSHPFNQTTTEATVIEKSPNSKEGSDSGVETNDLSPPHQKPDPNPPPNEPMSCDSSIISCCSNYEEAYNILVRRNSTLLEDYTSLRTQGDGTSENGSESSSIVASSKPAAKKRVSLIEHARKASKPPIVAPARLKSAERGHHQSRARKAPVSLELAKKDKRGAVQAASAVRTPSVTPTDDGRWPSVNSKPAPLMSRSMRENTTPKTPKVDAGSAKTIEKYATLPRRRKETPLKTEAVKKVAQVTPVRVAGIRCARRSGQKVRIYHEVGMQTALTVDDVGRALAGLVVTPARPTDVEKCDRSEQVDMGEVRVEELGEQVKAMKEVIERMEREAKENGERLHGCERRLREEIVEKEGLREELRVNSERVLAILGGDAPANDNEVAPSDSLMVLETRYQNVSQVVIRQEAEISKLNSHCRHLQIDLEKSLTAQKILVQQHEEYEAECAELHEFIQAEKMTLSDALKESENELKKCNETLKLKDEEIGEKIAECKRLAKLNEQHWQENLSVQARMGALEAKSREILVHQGNSVSGTAVALSALIGRLDGLAEELVTSYSISDQELDDLIYHNEVYSNSSSSPDATPDRARACKTSPARAPSPKKPTSFVSAVINAIKTATAGHHHQPNSLRTNLCSTSMEMAASGSNEMLDSETEPCLMMEHVLEDVVVPDGHSHNMISSQHSDSYEMPSLCEVFPSFSLVDQVIDVDNLVTRLLKVIRIIQLETDDCMHELHDERDDLLVQVKKQNETNRLVGKQLKDWEVLGARLKAEVRELMQQVSRKNNEIDGIKCELNKQRDEVEKLNQDVCELSTALSRAELDNKMKGEVAEGDWETEVGKEAMARLLITQNEVPVLREKLAEKEKLLCELRQEFLASKQVLTESLRVAVGEAKKQYDAIDNALEVLHNNENVVQQCTALAELQRELENTNFESALAMPLGVAAAPADCNANAALLQARAILQINSTA